MANLFRTLFPQVHPEKPGVTRRPGQRAGASRTEKAGRMPEIAQEPERTQTIVEKDDFLLSQIDEFREKAKQLQQLLAAKESKVSELQSIVSEREDKAQELAQILTERQEADRITTDFNQKVDNLVAKVTDKLTEMEISISNQIYGIEQAGETQLEANRRLNAEQIEASRNLSGEQIAAIRELSEEQILRNKQFLEEQAIANKRLSEGQLAEVRTLLEDATAQLDSIKTDLSEKVHSENVKCYRNIQDLFNEFDTKIEKMDEMERGVGSIRGYTKFLTAFSALNVILLIVVLLFSAGVFR